MSENIPAHVIDAIRARIDLRELVGRRVKLSRKGERREAQCEFHQDLTPSMSVWADHFHCFGCSAHGDAIAYVQRTEGLSFPEVVTKLAAEAGIDVGDKRITKAEHVRLLPDSKRKHVSVLPASTATIKRQAEDEARRIRNAVAIFEQAYEIYGTPGWHHLENRKVDGGLPSSCHHALRWHPKCPWRSGTHGCMVALFTDALTGEPKGIHRTAIKADGEKIGRLSLGPIVGCVIRLWPAASHRIVLGEGIETCLGAHRFHYFADEAAVRPVRCEDFFPGVPPGEILSPCWAAGFTENLAKFPVIPGVPKIFILVDHDENGAGQKAALECARRWHAAGRRVIRLTPGRVGEDFASNREAVP